MAGMFCLAKRIGSTRPVAVLAGLLFALSLSYTALGLTVAAIPAVLYLVQQESEGRGSLGKYALLFLLGWNSSLILSGMFLLAAMPLLRHVLFGTRRMRSDPVPRTLPGLWWEAPACCTRWLPGCISTEKHGT